MAPKPKATPPPPVRRPQRPVPVPSSSIVPSGVTSTPSGPVQRLQKELDVLTAKLPRNIRESVPRAQAVSSIPEQIKQKVGGGFGQADFLPVGTPKVIGTVFRRIPIPGLGRIPPRRTRIALSAAQHPGGVEGVFRHETAHQVFRNMGVRQAGTGGDFVTKKLGGIPQASEGVSTGSFLRLAKQVGQESLAPTKEQAGRTRRAKQRLHFQAQRSKKRKMKS